MSPTADTLLPRFVRQLRRFTVALHLLFALSLAILVGGTGDAGRWVLAALATAPLWLPLPGLLRGSAYTASWSSLIVVFYVALLLAEGYMQPTLRTVLVALSVLAAADFVTLMLYAKARKRVG